MFNSSLISNSSSYWPILKTMSLDELMDSLGFNQFLILTSTFVLPSINFIGLIFCTLSYWVFLDKRKFKDPSFFYYRLLCLVYIIHLIHNIPRGLTWTPQLFPQIDTYFTSIYKIYYAVISNLFYHYEDAIQIAILIDRITIFNSLARGYFNKLPPQQISIAFFITCLRINAPYAFSFKIKSFGTYYIYTNNNETQIETLYFLVESDFSLTLFGRIFLGFTTFFLNLFVTVVISVALNILSVYLYKSYLREKRQRENPPHRIIFTTISNDADESSRVEVLVPRQKRQKTREEIKERKAERNMLLMVLTLSSTSILSRITFMCCFIYYNINSTFSSNIIMASLLFSIYTLRPTLAIGVFYSFNKIFRKEFNKRVLRKTQKEIVYSLNQRTVATQN